MRLMSSSCGFLVIVILLVLIMQPNNLEGFGNMMHQEMAEDNSVWLTDAASYNNNMNHGAMNGPNPNSNMYYFANNQFKPECCPSTYSSSTGCACLSQAQLDFLNQRGGNRTIRGTQCDSGV